MDEPCHGDVLVEMWHVWNAEVWSIPAGMMDELISLIDALSWPEQKRPRIEGRGKCLGLTSTPSGRYVTPYRPEWEHVIILCRRMVHAVSGVDPLVSSVQINIDSVAAPHRDAYNAGWSWMLVGGSFSGGEFVTETAWEAQDKLFYFDGSTEYSSRPFSGH